MKENENLFIRSVVKCYLSFSLSLKQRFHLSVQIGDLACFTSPVSAFVLVLCPRGKKVAGSGYFLL